ncbi:MAG: EVE domain-containing protein [Dehalococcoidales bacterium]
MDSWIVQMNPKYFSMSRDYHVKGDLDWWGISKFINKIQPENRVYIWHSREYRNSKPAGIYAIGRVISAPPHSEKNQKIIDGLKLKERSLFLDENEWIKQTSKPSLFFQYTDSYIGDPLTVEEIKKAGLGRLHIITYAQQDICSISLSQAEILDKLLKSHTADP